MMAIGMSQYEMDPAFKRIGQRDEQRRGALSLARRTIHGLNLGELDRLMGMSTSPIPRHAIQAARAAVGEGQHPAYAAAVAKGLPLDEPSRQARARDLGFVHRALHGTTNPDRDWAGTHASDVLNRMYFGSGNAPEDVMHHVMMSRDFQQFRPSTHAKTSTALGPHFAPDTSTIPEEFAGAGEHFATPMPGGRMYPIRLRGGMIDTTQPVQSKGSFYNRPTFDDSSVHADALMSFYRAHPLELARMMAQTMDIPAHRAVELAPHVARTGMLTQPEGGAFGVRGSPLWSALQGYDVHVPMEHIPAAVEHYRKELGRAGTPIIQYHNTYEEDKGGDQRSWIQTDPSGIRSAHALYDPDLMHEIGLNYAHGGRVGFADGGATTPFTPTVPQVFLGVPTDPFTYGQGPEFSFFGPGAVDFIPAPAGTGPGTTPGTTPAVVPTSSGGPSSSFAQAHPELVAAWGADPSAMGALSAAWADAGGGGTSRGSGGDLGGGNPAGGQPGSAADPGSLGATIGSKAFGFGSQLLGMGTPASLFGALGWAAQQGYLGPNAYGNVNTNIDTNPSAYPDFAREPAGWLSGQTALNAAAQLQHSIDEAAGNPSGAAPSPGGWGNIGTTGDPGARDFSADPNRDVGSGSSGLGSGSGNTGSDAGTGRGTGTGSGTGEGGSERGGDYSMGGFIRSQLEHKHPSVRRALVLH